MLQQFFLYFLIIGLAILFSVIYPAIPPVISSRILSVISSVIKSEISLGVSPAIPLEILQQFFSGMFSTNLSGILTSDTDEKTCKWSFCRFWAKYINKIFRLQALRNFFGIMFRKITKKVKNGTCRRKEENVETIFKWIPKEINNGF